MTDQARMDGKAKCLCGKTQEQCRGWEDIMGQHKCPLMPRYIAQPKP
jgi:hypothetical protein